MLDNKPYKAPEITGITHWINSPPLTLAELKGKVVLIDFWTYSCINCIRTQPYLNAWYDKYKDDGFVIIGVHAPEFEFEKVPAHVERAVKDEKIKYPVAMDNDMASWQAFDNHYWPAKYLIDQEGKVVFTHFGEGAYDEMEQAIQNLLKKSGGTVAAQIQTESPGQGSQTPETYLGYERGSNFANASQFKPDVAVNYTLADNLQTHTWSLGGKWQIRPQDSLATDESNTLRIKFSGKKVFLVMDGPKGSTLRLSIDGKAVTNTLNGGQDVAEGGRVILDGPRMYRLINLPTYSSGATLDITIPKGVSVNAFTFG